MRLRVLGFAVLAVVGLTAPAWAGQRQATGEYMVAQDDSSDPTFLRKIPGIRLLLGNPPAETSPPEPQDSKKKKNKSFDESYYEPEPATPAQQKPSAPAKAKPPAKPAASAAPPMSCEQATTVVSGFGFSSVEAASCSGKLYAFNAKRDGKSFAIKLDPASGKLTEVKKLP
jgi:hypothetical protein